MKNCASTGEIKIARTDYRSNLYIGGFAARGKVGHCSLDNCISITDVIVTAGSEESPVQLSEKLYLGGLVGYVEYTKGITNSFYVSLNKGIEVISKIDKDTKDKNYISLTIGKTINLDSKVTNVYSYDDKLSVVGIVEEESSSDVYNQVVNKNFISSDISVLDENMQTIILTTKGIN